MGAPCWQTKQGKRCTEATCFYVDAAASMVCIDKTFCQTVRLLHVLAIAAVALYIVMWEVVLSTLMLVVMLLGLRLLICGLMRGPGSAIHERRCAEPDA